ncbi:MAG: ATP-binding protein [Candidatus Bathyarchaeota archaeon]|nr:ATP-binding protein [Candidatus Bathyarchaeota archaeon]
MKIAFVGAQCSGKTTALFYVFSKLKTENVNNINVIMETARMCPYPINKEADFRSQLWMLTEQMRQEADLTVKWQTILSDRSVIDPYIYYSYLAHLGKVENQKTVSYLKTVAENWIKLYPYKAFLFFKPLLIIEDPNRPLDFSYQKTIDELFCEYFNKKKTRNIYVVDQKQKTERQEYVLKIVKELIKNEEST